MNRLAAYFRGISNKSFAAEARDIMRCRAGLCKHDVHFFHAGWCDERSLWEIRVLLTAGDWFQVGSEDQDTCLELFREMMPAVKHLAQQRGIVE